MKIFCVDHNSIFKDIKKEFDITNNFDEADVIFLWNDVLPIERGIIHLAKATGKKVFVFQHGRKGSSKYYPPFNEKIKADKMFVWGEFDKQELIKAGQDGNKIKVIGTTIFKHLIPKKIHHKINIVFCPEHWDKPVKENNKVKDELKKLIKFNIITKTIDSPSHDGIEWQNEIKTNRDSDNHIDKCIELLATADIVVGISESTFELLAQAMNIPVIIVDKWEPKAFGGDIRYTTYRRLISPAVKKTTVENLKETILQQLINPDELKEERKQVVIDEGGLGLDTINLIKIL